MNASEDLAALKVKKVIKHRLRDIFRDWDKTQLAISLLIIFLLVFSPLVVKSPYPMGIIILTIIYAYVAISWNIVAGFAGLLLIGHVIFFGVGAFTTIMLLNHLDVSPWIGIPFSAAPAGLLGAAVAYLTSRYGLKRDYFALLTIALITVTGIPLTKFKVFGGAEGLWVEFRGESLRAMTFVSKVPYLYIALGLLLFGVIVQYKVYKSKMGKYMLAIREDEAAAAALGVNVPLYKMVATVIAAAMAGIGGGFYVMYTTYVDPFQVFNMAFNVEIALVSAIIGGLGTLIGPIAGAILNKPAVELIRGWFAAQRAGTSLIIYGLFLILFILFMPRGVAGLLYHPYDRLRRRLLRDEDRNTRY